MSGAERRECVEMGKGVSIARSAIVDRRLTALTEALATRESIPWQIAVEPKSTGTNTEALHLVGTGISVVDVGLPLTAMHTYQEALDMKDAEALKRLVTAFVTDREIAEVFAV
jgi:putative aminopeptidase FrvX